MKKPDQLLSKEVLASLDLRILGVQRITAGAWWNYRHVVSPFSRLWLILKGGGTVRHHDRRFILKPGRLHLVPAFTMHDHSCSRTLEHYYLHFVARLPTGIDLLSLLDCQFQLEASPAALGYFERLESIYPDRKLPCFDPFREEYNRFPVSPESSEDGAAIADWFDGQGILRRLLAPFLKSARPHEGLHSRVNDRFLAVQEFIHENMARPITLGDMAQVAGLHQTYFSDRFRQLIGIRPWNTYMRRRIERAQYLLLTTQAPVKEIAHQVGIADAAYFTRVFARACRRSPTGYRTSHGG